MSIEILLRSSISKTPAGQQRHLLAITLTFPPECVSVLLCVPDRQNVLFQTACF